MLLANDLFLYFFALKARTRRKMGTKFFCFKPMCKAKGANLVPLSPRALFAYKCEGKRFSSALLMMREGEHLEYLECIF